MVAYEIRAVLPGDEPQLLEVARHLNSVNLPHDPAVIAEIVEHTLITALERQLGDTLWNHPGARPHFYTQLWGTPTPAPPWPLFSTPHMLY